MKIRFLKDTYMRSTPEVSPDNILGVVSEGECVRVEKEPVKGQRIQLISNWYRDYNGRFYWAGAAEIAEDAAKKKWTFDPDRMNILISEWRIIERFWQQGILGEGARVGILSTGIDFRHPDLSANLKGGYNFCNPGDKNFVEDRDGEGTAVAGLIAARGAYQVYGLAPYAQLFIGKIAEDAGDYDSQRLIDALYWVLEQPIDLLYIGAILSPAQLSALEISALEDVLLRLKEKGTLIVAPDAPEKNPAFESSVPAASHTCLSVIEQEALPDAGPSPFRGFAAPGRDLLTAALQYQQGFTWSGQKAAAAIVSGLITLLGQSLREQSGSHSNTALWDNIQLLSTDAGAQSGYIQIDQFISQFSH